MEVIHPNIFWLSKFPELGWKWIRCVTSTYVEFYLYPIGLELLSMSYYCSLNVVAPLLQNIIWTNNVNGKSCLVPSWMLNAVSFKSIFHEPFCLWLAKRTWSDSSSTGFLISRFHLSNFLMIVLKHIMMNHNEPSGRMLWWDWDLLAWFRFDLS